MTKIINIFGRTTELVKVHMQQIYLQKWNNYGYKVELITEFAKDCVYENQLNILRNDQLFLLANQNRRIQRIIESNENIDYIITDSPLLLCKIFAIKNNVKHNYLSFQDFCIDLFASYNNINVVLTREFKYQTER
jgi:hypothetical protein